MKYSQMNQNPIKLNQNCRIIKSNQESVNQNIIKSGNLYQYPLIIVVKSKFTLFTFLVVLCRNSVLHLLACILLEY